MATSQLSGILALMWGVCLVCSLSVEAAPEDKPPFYKIEYKGKTAYLLGSVHVGKADFYPMAPQIESLFNSASALVVEADTANANISALLKKYGIRAVPADSKTQALLDSYCKTKGQMCKAMEGFSPWLQSMLFGVARFEALGYTATYGVEQRFISQNRGRPLLELESAEFQFQLMSSFNDETQWKMVKETIQAPDDDMNALVTAWRTGDESGLNEMMEGQMIDGDDLIMAEKVLWQRNLSMSAKIGVLMEDSATPQPMFIIVGAGHVVGPKSIVQELINHGAKMSNCWEHSCL
ncbi:MAG: hypothetical protein ACI8SK_001007 [Shewanella sp.]|jgi:uncharacterized protein YbaP (TraB family)